MSFFPLKFRCTLSEEVKTVDEARQKIVTLNVAADNVKCLFYEVNGGKITAPIEDFKGNFDLYLEPSTPVIEGMIVTNIRMKNGTTIQTGPFQVKKVTRVVNAFSGKMHHLSCKLEGRGKNDN